MTHALLDRRTWLAQAAASVLAPAWPAAQSRPLQPVTVILDWEGAQPQHMPYWLARERGWYAEHGLSVKIQPGRGSGQVAQVVAAGQAEFGQMTPVVLTQTVAKQKAPLKMVGVTFQRDTIALKYFKASGIRTPKDLEGRTVGLVPGTVNELLWRAFARAAGFDADKVKVVGVDFRTFASSFAAGQIEATNSLLGFHDNVRLTRQGRAVGEFVYSDYLPMVGFGLVASTRTLTERPELVQRMVRGTQKAWEYLLRSPREAVAEAARIITRNVEGTSDAEDLIVEASMQVIPTLMRSKASEGKPRGWSDPDDWARMVAVLERHDKLPRTPAVEELMTNRFVE
jgi:NitT/TauT family transport system substrate-binding protein